MIFKTISIFPEFFEKATDFSLLKKALDKNIIKIENYNLRDWAESRNVHKMIDDRPFGGGAGMVMMVEPVYKAIKSLKSNNKNTKIIIFSPKGKVYNQKIAEEYSKLDELILISPHYEGFDERILEYVDDEICIGDYVLTGGEIPSLIIIDSVSRLIPNVLGNNISAQTESFSEISINNKRNLEHPQYTRPAVFIDDNGNELKVPDVLLSGNHKEIEEWRNLNSK